MYIQDLTIAIITYKRKSDLKKCIDSILDQKYHPKEIIIINNDPFNQISIDKKATNISVLHQNINNISKSRNDAIFKCKTKYLAFLDDDCVLLKNWSNILKNNLNLLEKYTFLQGKSISISKSKIIKKYFDQENKYWKETNNKNTTYNQNGLDTKNIILNIEDIKNNKIFFDTLLPIFEDVDFGLQLKKNNLSGIFLDNLIVKHKEIDNIFNLISKFYYRGKIKKIITNKWGNYDLYTSYPNIIFYKNSLKNNFLLLKKCQTFFKNIIFFLIYKKDSVAIKIINQILNQSFSQGFLSKSKNNKKENLIVYISNSKDGSANEERHDAFIKVLSENNIKTISIDSKILFDKYINDFKYLFISPIIFCAYRLLRFFIYKFNQIKLKPWLFYLNFILKGKFLRHYIKIKKIKYIISQHPEELYCFYKKNKKIFSLIDSPTIFSEESKLWNKYPKYIIKKINIIEKKAHKNSNYSSFHWYKFYNIANKNDIKIKNKLLLNWGCYNKKTTSHFSKNPKIIYLGNLNSNWINQPFLEKLQQKSIIPLNIHSYENPDKNLYSKQFKTNGFLKDLNELSKFQFGLITLTNDDLRNNGFSAKHLQYLSYGLPVLCPETRKDSLLSEGTIYYNEHNFNSIIKKYSKNVFWQKKHNNCLSVAKKLNWNHTLEPLVITIKKVFYEN